MQVALLVVALSALLITLAWKKLKLKSSNKNRDSLDNLPSPPSLPFFGVAHHFLKPNLDELQLALDWTKKYGSIIKLNLFTAQLFAINEPSMIQKILESSNPLHLNKNRTLYGAVLSGSMIDGLVGADYDVWKPHRSIVAGAFSYKSQLHHLTLLNHHAKDFVKDTKKLSGVVKINDLVSRNILSFSLHIIMDEEYLMDDAQVHFHENFEICKILGSKRVLQPWLLFDSIWNLHPSSKELNRAVNEIKTFEKMVLASCRHKMATAVPPNSQIEKNVANVKNKDEDENAVGAKSFKHLMELLLESGLSSKEILDEVDTFLAAGLDTTSWSLSFLLFRLAIHPEVQEKCRQEVDEMFDAKMTRNNNENVDAKDLTMADVANLKYLERCILENLRLAPIVPGFVRQLGAKLELNENTTLPTGSTVFIFPWVVHRNPAIWPKPETFDPDRFLPENCKQRHAYSYIPFSAGPRNCLGWKTAIMTMKVMTAWLLRHFVVETPDKLEDLKLHFCITLAAKNDINLIFKKRSDIKP